MTSATTEMARKGRLDRADRLFGRGLAAGAGNDLLRPPPAVELGTGEPDTVRAANMDWPPTRRA